MTLCKHLLALALLALSGLPARGAGEVERLYTVFGIAVDETAMTAAEARLIAIEKAQNQAFQRVIQKLASDSEAALQLAEGARAADYLLGFEVVEEKNSRVRYIGKINIAFDRQKLEALFGAAGVLYVAIPPEPALVLPILAEDGVRLLWEDENLFHQAFAQADTQNRLTDFRLPEGTLEERTAVTAEQVLSGRNRERLTELARRYGATEAWAILARLERDTLGQPLALEVHLAPLTGTGETQTWTFAPELGEDDAQLFARAVEAVLADEDRAWKRVALSASGNFQEITVAVPVRSGAEWAALLADLKNVPVVREVKARTLALPESELALRYQGTLEQLRLALAQQGLVLFGSARGYSVTRKPVGEDTPE